MSSSTSKPVASTSKAYSTVSAASFLDLKAELGKHEVDFAKTKHLGSTTTGVKRAASGKPSIWAKRNKGIAGRNERDQIQYEADPTSAKHDPARLKAQLEKKALLYDKIRKGKTGGLDEAQIETLLVDFDRKNWDEPSDSDDSDDDESATVPVQPKESDPLVEWTDEFGRTRLIPRSEVPRGPGHEVNGDPAADRNVHYGDQHHFPVYTPDPAVLAARAAAYAKSEPLVSHYDAAAENRTKAAGFYAFSTDEATRADQMAALKREREETEATREQAVASGGVVGERERVKEERKRKVEEKRRELEEKRRAKAGAA